MVSRAVPQSPSPGATPGAGRRRWFRLAAVLLPFLLLGAVELGLRFRGLYTPTAFWLPTEVPGELTPNPHFADRFVGRTLARMARSGRVQEHPAPGTLRIVVFGESAALGDPEPAFGMSRCLEALLEGRFPGRKVEVINTAITALNSHAIREAARDSRRLGADFWVIYAGNNEVIGPFGPGSTAAGTTPSLLTTRLGLRLRQTALGQWLTDRPAVSGDGLSMTQRWTGLELFLNRQVAASDPRLSPVRENFRANLSDIVRLGTGSGAKVLLSTMAVNLVDCPPFSTLSASETNRPEFAKWSLAAAAARNQDEQGALAEAVAAWTNAAALWPDDAETSYRLGLARLNAAEIAAGRTELETARDLDSLRFRADSGILQVIRDVAKAAPTESVRLMDASQELRGTDPERPPGADLFFEHVHLRPEGNYRLARMFAEQIAGWLETPAAGARSTNWLAMNPCLERLGWSPFAESRLWGQIRALCERPPFSHQSNRKLRNRFLDDRIAEATVGARLVGFSNVVQRLRTTVEQHPADWHLREQLARLLQTGRRWTDASAEWRQVVGLAPGHVVGWYQLGESLSAAGDRPAAQAAYEKALSFRPDFAEASIGLGLVLGAGGKLEAAIQAFDWVLQATPNHLRARVKRGIALVSSGRTVEGTAELRRAAGEHPTMALPSLQLGEALAAQNDHVKAAEAYAEAVRRETNNVSARHRLAIELSKADRMVEAEAQFRQVIQERPTFLAAHLDLGVALAQRARFPEAIPEFEAVLKLQPTNALAQSYLQKSRAQLNPKGGQ